MLRQHAQAAQVADVRRLAVDVQPSRTERQPKPTIRPVSQVAAGDHLAEMAIDDRGVEPARLAAEADGDAARHRRRRQDRAAGRRRRPASPAQTGTGSSTAFHSDRPAPSRNPCRRSMSKCASRFKAQVDAQHQQRPRVGPAIPEPLPDRAPTVELPPGVQAQFLQLGRFELLRAKRHIADAAVGSSHQRGLSSRPSCSSRRYSGVPGKRDQMIERGQEQLLLAGERRRSAAITPASSLS